MKLFSSFFTQKPPIDKIKKKLISDYNSIRPGDKHGAFCWAPFTSLRFHRNGSVQVCCHHIDYYSLKDKSLKSIWFGNELEVLRTQMKSYNIPDSCNFCASEFFSENFTNVIAKSYDHYSVSRKGFPVFMDFSLDNRCNLTCAMCDASLSSKIQEQHGFIGNHDFFYNEQFVEQLKPFIPKLQGAVFTGGEPFLIEIYYEIWDLMLKNNPKMTIHITTNGTVLNNKVKQLLEIGKFHLNISIDSFRRDVYETIRKGAKWVDTMKNLDYFSNYCKNKNTQLTITTCPMQQNWKDVPEIVQKCNKNNWGFSFNAVIKPWHMALWSLNPNEINAVVNYYENMEFEKTNNSVVSINLNKFGALVNLLKMWEKVSSNLHSNNYDENKLKLKFEKGLIDLFSNIDNCERVDDEISSRIKNIVEKIPVYLLPFIDDSELNNKKKLIRNELKFNDNETVAEHFTISAFHKAVLGLWK